MNDRRKNWKQEAAENTSERTRKRQALMVEKELVGNQLQALTIEERRSTAYEDLKARQREILAELATL